MQQNAAAGTNVCGSRPFVSLSSESFSFLTKMLSVCGLGVACSNFMPWWHPCVTVTCLKVTSLCSRVALRRHSTRWTGKRIDAAESPCCARLLDLSHLHQGGRLPSRNVCFRCLKPRPTQGGLSGRKQPPGENQFPGRAPRREIRRLVREARQLPCRRLPGGGGLVLP